MSTLEIPSMALVMLVGASGSGKSTFAAKHFSPWEVLSSDHYRGVVSNDPNSQEASGPAFAALEYLADVRLGRGLLTVVDATNIRKKDRVQWVRLAKKHDMLAVAIVLDVPPEVAIARNRERPNRNFGDGVVRRHAHTLRRELRGLKREGIRYVRHLEGVEAIDAITSVERTRAWTDKRDVHGPFDIIGDVHGCYDELCTLLALLGWSVTSEGEGEDLRFSATHADPRTLVFLGDLCDRGPKTPEVFHLVMDLVEQGTAICVPGNHENKLGRYLDGRKVKLTHGLDLTAAQLATRSDAFRERVQTFIRGMVSHYVLDDGTLIVAHAGMKESYAGRASGRVRSFALYGETTGEIDTFGLPVRQDWARDYRGSAAVVYGHTPTPYTEWIHNTLCIDTGCVFGGELTALRWPEREELSVPAQEQYCVPVKPLEAPVEHAEVPAKRGVERVVCEEKHMGSRAMVLIGRDASALSARFEQEAPEHGGLILTRRGRRFFRDLSLEAGLIERVRSAMNAVGFWERFSTDWALIDAELMPWSAKAKELLETQYAPVGAAAAASLGAAAEAFAAAGLDSSELEARVAHTEAYRVAYRHYCWEVGGVEDLRLAPFHLLATEGVVHDQQTHPWHMQLFAELAQHESVLVATVWREVELGDEASVAAAVSWWSELTAGGGEGMVVKPLDFLAWHKGRLVQPALKVRGPEYLRIIYGPEYPAHLERLRRRGVGRKRKLAMQEFALGMEALHRFVDGGKLARVHPCVAGILALEAEPVDPRL